MATTEIIYGPKFGMIQVLMITIQAIERLIFQKSAYYVALGIIKPAVQPLDGGNCLSTNSENKKSLLIDHNLA